MTKKNTVPAGEGLEIDYEKYNNKPNKTYFTADDWWISFCSHGEKALEASEIKSQLLKELNGDIYLAMAVNHFVGRNFIEWLDKEGIQDLGGLTPRECLSLDYGMKRLRMLFLTA